MIDDFDYIRIPSPSESIDEALYDLGWISKSFEPDGSKPGGFGTTTWMNRRTGKNLYVKHPSGETFMDTDGGRRGVIPAKRRAAYIKYGEKLARLKAKFEDRRDRLREKLLEPTSPFASEYE